MDEQVQPVFKPVGGIGTIYLIHFDRPFKHARHYLGWTENLDRRVHEHLNTGEGSALMRAVSAAGIRWNVVKTWEGTRDEERRLHKQKNSPRYLCPVCRTKCSGK